MHPRAAGGSPCPVDRQPTRRRGGYAAALAVRNPCCLDGNLMSLRRVLPSLACLTLGLLSACALRPQYKDMVQQKDAAPVAAGQLVLLRVTNPDTGQPIEGAKVVAGTGRERLSATSDAQGR